MPPRYTFFIGVDEKKVDINSKDAAGHYAHCLSVALTKMDNTEDQVEIRNIVQEFFNNMQNHPVTEEMLSEHKQNLRTTLATSSDKDDIISAISGMPVPGQGYLSTEEESADLRPSLKG